MSGGRFVIVVADSAGCGALPDAREYGDEGSDTIGNTSRAVGGLALPNLGKLGLGHLTAIAGVPPEPAPSAWAAKMAERSNGKDTITGHWEMMGIVLREGLALYPQGFPPEIVEPFVRETGVPGSYVRTYNRKDFSLATPAPTVLEELTAAGVPVYGVGKIPDIFDRKGITEELHTEGNADGLEKTAAALDRVASGLVFVNLVDFDMLWGHRNDVKGYAQALEAMDRGLPDVLGRLREGDMLAITADHGCDPTTPSTDHSREYVPLLVDVPGRKGVALGTRATFADLGATAAAYFGLCAAEGTSFLDEVGARRPA